MIKQKEEIGGFVRREEQEAVPHHSYWVTPSCLCWCWHWAAFLLKMAERNVLAISIFFFSLQILIEVGKLSRLIFPQTVSVFKQSANFQWKKELCLKKKSNYIAVQNLVLSQSCICRLKTAWSCPLGLCNTVENQKVKDQAEYKKEINPWGYTCSPQDINTVVLPNWSSWRSFTSFPSPLL